jgi:hypothetical protein
VHKFSTTLELVDEAPVWKFEPESGVLNACLGVEMAAPNRSGTPTMPSRPIKAISAALPLSIR